MKKTTLGIDLGTNSIGWALIEFDKDQPCGLIDSGVRIFQEAVDVKTKIPKNQERRGARAARKLVSRRKMRRNALRNLLKSNSLLPQDQSELEKFFSETEPYALRKQGLDEELTLFEFGRIIYHLDQRRGFLSNRKAKDKKEEGKVKEGISQLKSAIGNDKYRTLGEFLVTQPTQRKRYTDRGMYRHEFEMLWTAQQAFHPQILTPELKDRIHKIIFFQRPLKLQRDLIGKCTFEPTRKRAAKALLPAQRFRILQDINNLKVLNPINREMRDLTVDERELLFDVLENAKTLTWNSARKKLGLHEGEKFNLELGNKSKLIGNRTACDLRNIVGKTCWNDWDSEQRNQLVTDILTIDHEDGFLRRMKEHWHFNDETAEKLLNLELESGYMNLSLKAVNKILPYLEKGELYDKACLSAGYIHSVPDAPIEPEEKLGTPVELRNPVVQKALWETRKVVNALIKKHGRPEVIRIEMARDIKLSQKQRQDVQKRQIKQRDENERINEILRDEFNFQQPSRDDRIKYQLWEECSHICPYTGKPISREMLFSPEVDVEHILPYSQSLDDSYMNKTLCLAKENRQVKRNRSPYEAYHTNEEKYQEMLLRLSKMKSMSYFKRRKFEQKEINTDEFIERQLNDTRYICTEVKKYLKQLGVNVDVSKGFATAQLRRKWRLNDILPPPKDVMKGRFVEKIRTDHRHHAIDAIVTACTTRGLFQRLSRESKQSYAHYGIGDGRLKMDPPWLVFNEEVQEAIDEIIISHAPLRKIHGALHEETAYGLVGEGKKKGMLSMVYRVRLDGITLAQVKKIRDETVKELALNRLEEFDGNLKKAFGDIENPLLHKDGKTPIHTFRILTEMSEVSMHGISKGQDKQYKYFAYGSNHHVEIFENTKGKRQGRFVTTFEAARRVRRLKKKSPIDMNPSPEWGDGWRFITSLHINDMVEFEEGDVKRIYRVQMLSDPQITFRLHTAATLNEKSEVLRKNHNVFRGRKINIDPIGNVIDAHD